MVGFLFLRKVISTYVQKRVFFKESFPFLKFGKVGFSHFSSLGLFLYPPLFPHVTRFINGLPPLLQPPFHYYKKKKSALWHTR